MTQDATFEDDRERPLNLGALDQDDLQVVSTLIQDAVFPASEMIWDQGSEHRCGGLDAPLHFIEFTP